MVPDDELTMGCSDGNKVGSNCTFECPPDQVFIHSATVRPPKRQLFSAIVNVRFQTLIGSKWRECTSTGQWSNTLPICRQCSHLKSDLVFIIDGSWSVGDSNFKKAKDFMKALGKIFQKIEKFSKKNEIFRKIEKKFSSTI